MKTEHRREILDRLNALDSGPTHDDRIAERRTRIGRAIEVEWALKWGRITAGGMWGIAGRSVEYR